MASSRAASAQASEQYACLPFTGNFLPHRWQGLTGWPVNNYYNAEVNDEGDQSPIGIVLCTDKHEVMAEFALGGLANTIFASRYTYYIPDKDQLIHEVKMLLESEEQEPD